MANSLKAGTTTSFHNSLASYMEAAMQKEWQAVRDEQLPEDDRGAEDRRILFAAIAQGVLRFLYDHRDDLLSTREIHDGNFHHRHEMDFTVSGYRP